MALPGVIVVVVGRRVVGINACFGELRSLITGEISLLLFVGYSVIKSLILRRKNVRSRP
jgi:hypothetical protein